MNAAVWTRVLKEWLDDGAIGDVTEVHAWTDRPVGGDPWSDFVQRAMLHTRYRDGWTL